MAARHVLRASSTRKQGILSDSNGSFIDEVDLLPPASVTGDDLVSVAQFLAPAEAQMAKGMLEGAGIGCFLQGANANSLYPGSFSVSLDVAPADEAAARALLAEAVDTPVEATDGGSA
jgi:hypothetical protein